MANNDDKDERRAMRDPIISPGEIIVLAVVAALGLLLAVPQLENSWLGYWLSGHCDVQPRPLECAPPRGRFR